MISPKAKLLLFSLEELILIRLKVDACFIRNIGEASPK